MKLLIARLKFSASNFCCLFGVCTLDSEYNLILLRYLSYIKEHVASSVAEWSRPVSRNLQFVGSSQVEADTWRVRALSCFAVCIYTHFHMHEHSGGTWLSEIVLTSLSTVFTCFSGTTGQMLGCVLGQPVCAIP
jgi:hypothetical protein